MKAEDINTVGFIGLGVMGEAMCRNLVGKGTWTVMAYDLSPEPVARIAQAGGLAAVSAADVIQRADVVITCLPGGNEVRALLMGTDRLADRLRAGQILIDMSTSPPSLMEELARAAEARGAGFADAPIARTRQAAADGTLLIMVGAEPGLFEKVKPVLSTIGSDVVHCGAPGAGQVVKIMNNMVLFETVAALSEALSIGEACGVDGKTLFDILSMGSADSFALRNHGMKSILPDDFPDRAFSVKYAAKDLSYALEMARAQNVHAPGAANVADLFAAAVDAGNGDRYFPVIRRQLADTGEQQLSEEKPG